MSLTIKCHYSDAKMLADVLNVNDAPFLASTHEHVHYGTTSTEDDVTCENVELEL